MHQENITFGLRETQRISGKKVDKQKVLCAKNEYVEHQYVKMYYKINHFTKFPFFGTHNKPHGVGGLSKHYHMHFDPKI